MSGNAKRKRAGIVLLVAAAVLAAAALAFGGFDNNNKKAAADPVAFDEDNPAVGSQDNDDPVVPEEFQDWTDVAQYLTQPDTQWYADCLGTRLGISRENVGQYAKLVEDGHDLRFIVISNSNVSDEEARERLREQGLIDVDQLPIRRLSGFDNTRGLPSDRCNPFGDDRNQVRISLAIPMDVNDISKGLDLNRGVLAMCGNPWKLPPEQPPAPPTSAPPVSPPTARPTTTTTPPTTAPPSPATVCEPGKCVAPTTTTTPPTTAPPPPTTAPPSPEVTSPPGGNTGQDNPPQPDPPGEAVTTTSAPPGGVDPL